MGTKLCYTIVKALGLLALSLHTTFSQTNMNNTMTFEPTPTPTMSLNMTNSSIIPPDIYLGRWKLFQANAAEKEEDIWNSPVKFPPDFDIILTFGEGYNDFTYTLNTEVVNVFMAGVKVLGEGPSGFDLIEVDEMISTQIYPSEEFLGIEKFFWENLENMDKMRVTDGGELVMIGPYSLMICEPHSDA